LAAIRGRQTPQLTNIANLYYFDNVVSCGTATAVSVPCIFSPQGSEGLDVARARHHSNLLDALQSAGLNVEWRENNSGSKGVAARVKTLNFISDANAWGCSKDGCYDEDMISGLAERLKGLEQSSVIVFHDMGSHGPAYWRRYPRRFEKFTPVCRTSELWTCSHESLINTYDNTILYTDHVLAEQIRLLQSVSAVADSLLIYVSDHGESLGEHGLYLHGAPYAFAPEEQIKVPYLIWMSEGYRQRYSVDDQCLQKQRRRSLTHDTFYHTVLGALGLRNTFYKQDLDLIGPCWGINQAQ
jgi:lipid A ethanolaminephosphotransferase